MNPNKQNISSLEALPQDLLGKIVAKVGATSPEDYHNLILTCKELGSASNDERVLKNLNLAPLVKKPLASIKYLPIMKKCLAANNPDAHYIKGIIRYFLLNDTIVGLYHISIAADAGKKEAIYLYAILLLCNGDKEEGKTYMNQLKWAENNAVVETYWRKVKTSLHGIRVQKKRQYVTSLRKMKPPSTCHLRDFETTCECCFYYKRMVKFVFMI